jgi:ERCC4-type nuclease
VILVDDRAGSSDLLKPLLAAGLPAEMTRLDSADLAFIGRGPKGVSLDIGIELKRLDGSSTDLTQSLRSGRLAGHQLPKMVGARGAYDHAWLLVEGIWRHDENGQVVVYRGTRAGWQPIKGRMSAVELEKQLLTFELCGGLHVRYTNTRMDTVRFVAALYRWFSDKAMDKHSSHLKVHDTPTLTPVSDYRAYYMKIPGVGYRLSQAVENHFKGGPRQAACAGINEWAEIAVLSDDGKQRKLGNKTATRIVSFLRGGI